MAKVIGVVDNSSKQPTFQDIKEWYEKHMHPSVIDFDDPLPYKVYAEGRWAGIFQLTSTGAQRLFMKAKPKSIIDIATLTSIYRPGPLAADVDKLYLEAKNDDKQLEWGDQRINKILEKTHGLLIFQESVMELAEKVAGFPKDKCDEVRRAIMKRSISGGEAAKKAAQETRDEFVKGCIANGYTEAVANNLYDKILYFAGYGFNKTCHYSELLNIYFSDGRLKETKQLQHVEPGDLVMSRDEASQRDVLVAVKAKHDHGVLDLVEVELTSGEKVRCTMDHKFRVQETGEMLPLWMIQERGLSIVVNDAIASSSTKEATAST